MLGMLRDADSFLMVVYEEVAVLSFPMPTIYFLLKAVRGLQSIAGFLLLALLLSLNVGGTLSTPCLPRTRLLGWLSWHFIKVVLCHATCLNSSFFEVLAARMIL